MATICCRGRRFESIQAVLFDKDGTLADVEAYLRLIGEARSHFLFLKEPRLKAQCVEQAMEQRKERAVVISPLMASFGLENGQLDPAGLLAVGSRQENEIAAAAYLAEAGWSWIEALQAAKTAFTQADAALTPKAPRTSLIEGVSDLLRRLKASNVKIGIVSADLYEEVAAFIKHYNLDEVDWFCGASAAFLLKTHPEFLAFACATLSVEASQTLVIGDSASDQLLASRGAAGFLGMAGGWSSPPAMASDVTCFLHLSEVEVFV